MADPQFIPVDHDPFASASDAGAGGGIMSEVSPLERYKFQSDVPDAVKRATPDYGIIARGQKQGGHYSEMTPEQRESYAHGFSHAAGMLASFLHPALGAAMMGG